MAAPVSLESLVRPFASTPGFAGYNKAGGTAAPSGTESTSAEDSIPRLTWSCTASATTLTLAAQGFDVNLDDTPQDLLELTRTTTTKHVTNPDDPSQFVDVADIDQILFKDDKGNNQLFTLNNADTDG